MFKRVIDTIVAITIIAPVSRGCSWESGDGAGVVAGDDVWFSSSWSEKSDKVWKQNK